MKKIFTNKIVVALVAMLCCALWGSAFPSLWLLGKSIALYTLFSSYVPETQQVPKP